MPKISSKKTAVNLEAISEEELLKIRICDLPISIKGSWLEDCIKQLYAELEAKGIIFKPACYLADEWLTPEHETCIGIPFYLAHPTLIKLEKKIMFDAEGEHKPWCMKLLRHEAGHAICYAYRFHKRRRWQRMFGPSTKTYSDTYKYRPYSKNYVRHLDGYYAQYHPDEDFVETFAVWLTPDSDWGAHYQGWKAMAKLKYVDQLMKEIQGKLPKRASSVKYWRQSTLRMTLANHYKRKRFSLAEDIPDFHDNYLKKYFDCESGTDKKLVSLAKVILKYRKDIIYAVVRNSGERKYVVNDLVKDLLKRARMLKASITSDESSAVAHVASYITSLIMNYMYTGYFRGDKRKIKKYGAV